MNNDDGMMDASEMCIRCRFYELDEDRDDMGACRRYPRTFHPQGGWMLAIQKPDDWCGEFVIDKMELN